MIDRYVDQARLLIDVLPHIAQEEGFALKGGTAINLFYRDMPRLSVDIDLTYLPVEDRAPSLRHIDEALDRIAGAVSRRRPRYQVRRLAGGGNTDTRIMIRDGGSQIKIETSPVTRGAVLPPVTMTACRTVIDRFGFVETTVLSFQDLYGGKLHAALDRQHPRDLFDVKLLYENEGLTEDIFRVFMVYVAGSSRPMHELLAPGALPPGDLYGDELAGMTRDGVSKRALDATRLRLHADIRQRLTGDIAAFLLSVHDSRPAFDLIGFPEAERLPAVRWKLANVRKLARENPEKHFVQRKALEDLFQ